MTTLRIGLPKFYTLSIDAISETKRKLLPTHPESAFYHHETLAQVRKAIISGAKIEVQQSLKTNGDCVQISWSTRANAWVIASKNVCLLAQTANDVKQHYPDQSRYYLVRKMALWWFRKVNNITNLGQGRLESL